MQKSESIASLAPAFVKAQRQVEGARKDSANPGYKSRYADLGSVWDACRLALQMNDLAVMQFPVSADNGVGVETILIHASGEWISERYILPFPMGKGGEVKMDAQAGGSCITYARRYGLAALMGVCPEDDDGNAAAESARKRHEQIMLNLKEVAAEGMASYQEAWEKLTVEDRRAVGTLAHNGFKGQAASADARKSAVPSNGKGAAHAAVTA